MHVGVKRLTTSFRQNTLHTVSSLILKALQAGWSAVDVTGKVTIFIISTNTVPRAVLPVEVLCAAKLEAESEELAEVPSIRVRHDRSRAVPVWGEADRNQEVCY